MPIPVAIFLLVGLGLIAKGFTMKRRGESAGEKWILGGAVAMFLGAIALLNSGAAG